MIQQIVYRYLSGLGWNAFYMAALCFGLTLIFAIASWYIVEKNAQKLGQYLIYRMRERKAVA